MGTTILRQNVRALVFFTALGTLLSACQNDKITGRWESVEQKGGLASIVEIRSDGIIKSSLVARINRNYRIERDKLIFTRPGNTGKTNELVKQPAAAKKLADKKTDAKQNELKHDEQSNPYGEGDEPVVYTFAHANDKLKLTHDESKQIIDMRREGQTTAPSEITGHWSFKHTSGQTAHMVFEANGIVRFRMVFAGGAETSYKTKDDSITLYSADNKPMQSVRYKLQDGKLVLNDGNRIIYYGRLNAS